MLSTPLANGKIASLGVLASTFGARALIVPDEAMTIAGARGLHERFPDVKILVLDNNPFNRSSPEDAAEFLAKNSSWFRVVDHHGPFNDGRPMSTLPRLLAKRDQLSRDGFLGKDAIMVTNMGNLDPDGLLSFYAVARPEMIERWGDLLEQTANYTDFALFGRERFDSAFALADLALHERLGLALLQTITDEKHALVERTWQARISELTPDQIRQTFLGKSASAGQYNASAVHGIYLSILNQKIDSLLGGHDATTPNTKEIDRLADRATTRLKAVYKQAATLTRVHGVDAQYPQGKVTELSSETGFTNRLDTGFPVHDWLMESAGQYVNDAPLHIRLYRGMLIVSVRYPRRDEQRIEHYDLSKLIQPLNDVLLAGGAPPSLYGRKEVVLGHVNSSVLTPQKVLEHIDLLWDQIRGPART